jgi:hypothetical protein
MRFILLVFSLVVCTAMAPAQNPSCKDLSINDTKLPIYPPIARLAHMQGTIRFRIHLSSDGKTEVEYLDGPNKGAFATLLTNAREYAADRQHGWTTGGQHLDCDYTLAVEYRIVLPEVDPPNNFLRVTVIDEGHTLIEARSFKPTCFDCRN